MKIDEMQTYKRYPTLDMVKKETGVDLDELNKSVRDMDSLLCDALAKVAEHYKAAENAFEKLENVCPGCPDGEDGFGELTEKEAEAEYEKYRLVTAHGKAVESALYNLEEMKLALERLTNG